MSYTYDEPSNTEPQKNKMHYMLIWAYGPDHANATVGRFAETGAPSPKDVAMQARWHDVAAKCGFAIAECDDVSNIAQWVRQWHDFL
jgi:hypothetical protein